MYMYDNQMNTHNICVYMYTQYTYLSNLSIYIQLYMYTYNVCIHR